MTDYNIQRFNRLLLIEEWCDLRERGETELSFEEWIKGKSDEAKQANHHDR